MTTPEQTGVRGPVVTDTDGLCALLGIPFSDQQLTAITAPLEPGVVVAGAGSGKTTVMAARVVWLVATGAVRPEQVLGLTFTNKAARELQNRVLGDLSRAGLLAEPVADDPTDTDGGADQLGEPEISTYHAYAGRLLGEHGLRLGVEPGSTLLADASRYQLAAAVIRNAAGPFPHISHHLPTIVRQVLELDSELADHLVSHAGVTGFDAEIRGIVAALTTARQFELEAALAATTRDELLGLVEAYGEAKTARGLLDFSDQMAWGARLALSCPEVGVAERRRFAVVLLDEYQDTSVAQRRMLTSLFSGGAATDGRGFAVTAVGDPCQAIYGWRGASVANLDEFPGQFPRADGLPATRFALNVSRRCGTEILRAANAHAADLYDLHPGVQPLVPAPGQPPGEVRAGLFVDRDEEFAWVADAILTRHRPGVLAWSDVGILMRTNAELSALHAALVRRGIPVEVVGLGGLLQTPAVADVVATLQVLNDLTENAALLRLLTGPRWRIGPRDLALLAARASYLARAGGEPDGGPDGSDGTHDGPELGVRLAEVVAAMDPTEVTSLAEALADPGTVPYSDEARQRFGAFSSELAGLRRHLGEPILDVVRRVITTIGLDVELDASPELAVSGESDNLAAFVEAVGEFATGDHDQDPGTVGAATASLDGLLSYLEAEDFYGTGLDLAVPSEADSVKLLTVHRAKGLEWPVVFVPTMVAKVFPSIRGRNRWTSSGPVLPWPLRGDADALPGMPAWGGPRCKQDFDAEVRAVGANEERRLGYVAITRAKRELIATGHWWGPTQKLLRGPSEYLTALREFDVGAAGGDATPWAERPAEKQNPAVSRVVEFAWPATPDPDRRARIETAAELVETARRDGPAGPEGPDGAADLLLDEQATVARWDDELTLLLAEDRESVRGDRQVTLPTSLSATQTIRAAHDREGLARDLARPMPRRPDRAAVYGTRFHAWVERWFSGQQLLDPDDLPGAADEDISSADDLAVLIDAFRTGPFAERIPAEIEAPFMLALDGRMVRGRIDAVYTDPADGPDPSARRWLVVDWKTNRRETADPLQLAIYRLAWAELQQVPVEQVDAAFYYVRTGHVVHPDLPGEAELLRVLRG